MAEMYREVPLLQQCVGGNKAKSISISSAGGYHAMLMDSKTSEIAGGFRVDHFVKGVSMLKRFIHWRTIRETIFLTETCLNRNQVCYELKITFEGSPILAVECFKSSESPLLLVFVTTTSIHRMSFEMPATMDHHVYTEQDSILLQINENMISDPLHCYSFINDIGQAVPLVATIANSSDNLDSKIAIACTSSLYLMALGIEGDRLKVQCLELDHNPLAFSKLIFSIADSWRRKSYTCQVVAMSFDTQTVTEHKSLLYTLHRNGALRVWLLGGRSVVTEYLSKYTQGSETEFHTCILRSSRSLVALYFSFQTFSEFVIIRPEVSMDSVTGIISSVVLKKKCTILAPNYDLIDFKLCDERLWTLWCNAEGESQALFYELSMKDAGGDLGQNVWSPIILENISDKEHSLLEVGVDLKDVYCNRIFQSGNFPDKVIRKSLTMFNRNTASMTPSSTAINYNMLRLKRYALTCIERQLEQECATVRQNGPLDNDQIQEISNGLWEKFYLYCVQYRYESSRPIGLFICEGAHNATFFYTAGIIRKKYISFFRVCDDLEVAFYSPSCHDHRFMSGSPNDSSLKENREMMGLVKFLGEIEQTLTAEQKHKLDSFIHQRRESESTERCMSFIGASPNQLLVHNLLPAFLQRVSNLPKAITELLQYVTPLNKDDYLSAFHEGSDEIAVCNYDITSEIALTTAKQTIQFRFLLLRNLLLLEYIIQRHCNFHYFIIDAIKSTIGPDTENILRCYHVMNWIAQTRLDIDWTKSNKIAITLPWNIRTSLTLLQAYAISQINEEISYRSKTLSSSRAMNTVVPLSLTDKTNTVIAFICPSSDDFLFGEWLSQNELHVHIDEYVRLLSNWCEWNSCSRNFIKAKSCLSLGDTSKALDLFPLSLKGIQNERILKKFLCQDDNKPITSHSTALTSFYLKLIRLFQKDGAYDGVLKLVHSGIDNTIDPMQQTMFQSIEFNCHIELGHYVEAYNALIKNREPARKKDCLRQLVCLLFSVRRLDILLDLPYYGLEEEFTNIVGMSARSTDIADCLQYNFLYSFYVNKMNLRKAAIVAYEEGMRNYLECNSLNHLNRYYSCLLKCLNSLSVIKEAYAWILHPIIEQVEAPIFLKEDIIDIVDKKRLEEQLITTHCALQLSIHNDGFKLVSALDATNLISLMMKRKLYRSALKLARCRMHSMVSTIYEHITSACITAASSPKAAASNIDSATDIGLPWLDDNCLSDLVVVPDSTATAWNYLRHTIEQENEDLVSDAYLAVFNRILSRCAYIPTWLKKWCFENIPTQFIRAYLRHGRLDEAFEYTIELFKTIVFSTGRFNQHTIFPLSLCEYLSYELETSSTRKVEMQQIEHYLRIIEVAL